MTDQTPGRYRDHRTTTNRDMAARARGERAPTEPRQSVWSPEEMSLIRHIAEEAMRVQAGASSAEIYSAATREAKAATALATARLRLAVWTLAGSLVSALGALAIAYLIKTAREVEVEVTPPIAIPIVEPSPNAEQVETQGEDLRALRDDIEALRAELAAERAKVKPRKGSK